VPPFASTTHVGLIQVLGPMTMSRSQSILILLLPAMLTACATTNTVDLPERIDIRGAPPPGFHWTTDAQDIFLTSTLMTLARKTPIVCTDLGFLARSDAGSNRYEKHCAPGRLTDWAEVSEIVLPTHFDESERTDVTLNLTKATCAHWEALFFKFPEPWSTLGMPEPGTDGSVTWSVAADNPALNARVVASGHIAGASTFCPRSLTVIRWAPKREP
jgi:hypothetical protein